MRQGLSILALMMAATAAVMAQAPTPGWQLSGEVSQGFNSNVTAATHDPEGDATTAVTLQLGRGWSTPHSQFLLTYVPEGMNFARHTSLDYIAQSLQQSWQFAATGHTSLSWNSSVQRYPERGGAAQMGAASLTGLQGASQAQQADTLLTSGNSSFGVQHQSSLRATWSAQFTGAWMGFQQDDALAAAGTAHLPSSQTRSLSSNGNWNYRLTPGRSLGISATESELWFTAPARHARYANLQATLSQQWAGTTVQIGAGPAWNWMVSSAGGASRLPPHSWSANLNLMQQIGQAQLGVNWSHQVQASLVPGSLSTDEVALQYQQAWGRWNVGASLGNTRLQAALAGQPPRSGLFAAAQLGYQLTQWSLSANCNYYSQDVTTGPALLTPLRRLQASLGVRYAWKGSR
jgi:hypothetical protein